MSNFERSETQPNWSSRARYRVVKWSGGKGSKTQGKEYEKKKKITSNEDSSAERNKVMPKDLPDTGEDRNRDYDCNYDELLILFVLEFITFEFAWHLACESRDVKLSERVIKGKRKWIELRNVARAIAKLGSRKKDTFVYDSHDQEEKGGRKGEKKVCNLKAATFLCLTYSSS